MNDARRAAILHHQTQTKALAKLLFSANYECIMPMINAAGVRVFVDMSDEKNGTICLLDGPFDGLSNIKQATACSLRLKDFGLHDQLSFIMHALKSAESVCHFVASAFATEAWAAGLIPDYYLTNLVVDLRQAAMRSSDPTMN